MPTEGREVQRNSEYQQLIITFAEQEGSHSIIINYRLAAVFTNNSFTSRVFNYSVLLNFANNFAKC